MNDPWIAKFDNILRKYGHNVLLQRRLDRKGDSGVYRPKDNHGFSNKLERHTVRSRLSGRYHFIANMKEEFPEGLTYGVDKLYYFRYNVEPSRGDRVYEMGGDGRELYLIDWTHAFRGQGGQIIYWAAGGSITEKLDDE